VLPGPRRFFGWQPTRRGPLFGCLLSVPKRDPGRGLDGTGRCTGSRATHDLNDNTSQLTVKHSFAANLGKDEDHRYCGAGREVRSSEKSEGS
jgi:hypothetical protein